MIKMIIRSGDKEFEFEGEKAEILDIYHEIMKTSVPIHAPEHAKPSKLPTTRKKSNMEIPSDDNLAEYILSKPNYSHDIVEIEKHFFGKRIPARENPSLYRNLAKQLREVRKKIEKEKQGEFEAITGKAKNLKRYVFRPSSTSKIVWTNKE